MPRAVSQVEGLHDQPAQVAVVAGKRRVLLRALFPNQLHDPLRVLLLDLADAVCSSRRSLWSLAGRPTVSSFPVSAT